MASRTSFDVMMGMRETILTLKEGALPRRRFAVALGFLPDPMKKALHASSNVAKGMRLTSPDKLEIIVEVADQSALLASHPILRAAMDIDGVLLWLCLGVPKRGCVVVR